MDNNIPIYTDTTYMKTFEEHMQNAGPHSPWRLFQAAYQTELMSHANAFDGLLALSYLPHMEFLDYQIQSCKRVIEEMNGRAILADEVGLGKTIEAGLIIKEYMIRGLAKKILILVPASLVNQWQIELQQKFYIPAVSYRKNYSWEHVDVMISSIDTAKQAKHQDIINNMEYDLLLVDEAHKLKNHRTQNHAFIRSIHKKYCLLLTATPVQNELMEIYNLVSILKPGLLGHYDSFLEMYGKDRSKMREDAYLKQLISQVMIRNTRQETTITDNKRHVETFWIDMKDEEQDIYRQIAEDTDYLSSIRRITLLREFCSSREACYLTLKKMIDEDSVPADATAVAEQIEQLPQHTKAEKAVEIIHSLKGEKVILFTEYRATQFYLQWYLREHGITSVPYSGGIKRNRKDWMRQLFENNVQVLIATEAGGEGINLQFCNHLINFDLPWNPMRMEQRIGRIHRFGQTKDVHIYNISFRNTFEEHIMKLLYEKIDMFELIIGELDDILEKLQMNDMESEMKKIMEGSASEGELKVKMDNLSAVIANTKQTEDREDDTLGYGTR